MNFELALRRIAKENQKLTINDAIIIILYLLLYILYYYYIYICIIYIVSLHFFSVQKLQILQYISRMQRLR